MLVEHGAAVDTAASNGWIGESLLNQAKGSTVQQDTSIGAKFRPLDEEEIEVRAKFTAELSLEFHSR